MNQEKKITLHFVEEVMYGEKSKTHAGGRIEIWENDKEYHTEEMRFLLPREMFDLLKKKLDFMEIIKDITTTSQTSQYSCCYESKKTGIPCSHSSQPQETSRYADKLYWKQPPATERLKENWEEKFDELFYQNEKRVWISRDGESYDSVVPEMGRGELFRFIKSQIQKAEEKGFWRRWKDRLEIMDD